MNAPRALAVFDLDGTLLRGPTVCEVLARPLGRLARMHEIERLRERGESDAARGGMPAQERAAIEAARKEMAGWYSAVPAATLIGHLQAVELAPGAERGVALLRAHGVAVGIASITWSFAVERVAARLGIEHTLGTVLEASGDIRHVWAEHKAEWLLSLAARLGVERERTAAVGDSSGDHPMLATAGKGIWVGTHAPALRPGWRHCPGADIEDVARDLIEAWELGHG